MLSGFELYPRWSIYVASSTFCLLYRIYRILYGKCGRTVFYARVVDVYISDTKTASANELVVFNRTKHFACIFIILAAFLFQIFPKLKFATTHLEMTNKTKY